MDFERVFFDLDGTLTDPFEGITNSVAYALEKSGVKPPDRSRLACFIGPPLHKSFAEEFGFSNAEALKAVEYYREYYADKGIFENAVFDGVPEMLEALLSRGKKLAVATSKPEEFAEIILRHYNLERYFYMVAGATMDTGRTEKSDVIAYALEKGGVRANAAIMVGDRKHDILGAKANGLFSCGVLYGYGSEEELIGAGADYLAKTPEDLLSVIK